MTCTGCIGRLSSVALGFGVADVGCVVTLGDVRVLVNTTLGDDEGEMFFCVIFFVLSDRCTLKRCVWKMLALCWIALICVAVIAS